MSLTKYTIEEISYSQRENRRIMESVLRKWLANPKEMNFFSPEMSYPFNFKKWIKLNYSNKLYDIKTLLLKDDKWIIGHVSIKMIENIGELFHLFVDAFYRKSGLGSKLINESEKYVIDAGMVSVMANLNKKDAASIKLFNKMGFYSKRNRSTKMIKSL